MYNKIYSPNTKKVYSINSKDGLDILKKYIMQSGGAKCSLCGALRVTKATCPMNPKSKNPKPKKHIINTILVKPKTIIKIAKIHKKLTTTNFKQYIEDFADKLVYFFTFKSSDLFAIWIKQDSGLSVIDKEKYLKMLKSSQMFIEQPFMSSTFCLGVILRVLKPPKCQTSYQCVEDLDQNLQQYFNFTLDNNRTQLLKKNIPLVKIYPFFKESLDLLKEMSPSCREKISLETLIRPLNVFMGHLKFGKSPSQLTPNKPSIYSNLTPAYLPSVLKRNVPENMKLFTENGIHEDYNLIMTTGKRHIYTPFFAVPSWAPSNYTNAVSYRQYPSKTIKTETSRWVDCFIRSIMNVTNHFKLTEQDKDITPVRELVPVFINNVAKMKNQYTLHTTQLQFLTKMDPNFVYGFTRYKLYDVEMSIPFGYYDNLKLGKTKVSEILSDSKFKSLNYQVWLLFFNLDKHICDSVGGNKINYITTISVQRKGGTGHWFNFGFYNGGHRPKYFYQCIQSGRYYGFSSLREFTEWYVSFEPLLDYFVLILRVPRNKKALRRIKILKNLSIPIEVRVENILIPTNMISFRTKLISYFSFHTHIMASKNISIKQLANIIKSHPEFLGLTLTKISSLVEAKPRINLTSLPKSTKIGKHLDKKRPILKIELVIPDDMSSKSVQQIKKSVKKALKCRYLKKNKPPKCNEQPLCEWVVKEGCKIKKKTPIVVQKSCSTFKMNKDPKCKDQTQCKYKRGLGCVSK